MEKNNIKDIAISTTGCAGLCSHEPMVTVEMFGQAPVKYIDLDINKMKRILDEHIIKGNIVKECALAIGSERVG